MNFASSGEPWHLMVNPSRVSIRHMLAGTLVLNTVIAVAITVFGSDSHGHGFAVNFVFSQCIGLITYALIDLPRRRLWPTRPSPLLPLIALVLVAASIGWYGGSLLGGLILGIPGQPTSIGTNAAVGFLTLTIAAGFGATLYFSTRERLAASEKLAAEARLKLLTAQIEPHFLFNTLANLQALIASDPARAQTMLAHLDQYLRASLSAARSETATLGEEFSLLNDYLEIIAIRMGPRLAFTLDLPAELAQHALPPMLLQPLVENAIRHGLEPKIEGGLVQVTAHRIGTQLVLSIEDDGLGLSRGASHTAGTGLGIAHVRERLAATYGRAAGIDIDSNPAGGATVTLRMPL